MENGTAAARDVPTVTGRAIVPASTLAFRGAVLHVRLEDVSYADKQATVVGEAVIPGVAHEPGRSSSASGDTAVAFSVQPAAAIDPASDYNVRAWLDRNGDGKEGPGDLWSDRSHRVLTHGFGRDVVITLSER